MEKIRIDNGTKRIEVNDNGDFIELPLGDKSFPDRFFNFANKVIGRYEEVSKSIDLMEAEEQRKKMLEIAQANMKDVDELFGDGTCNKVFGNIIPDDYMIMELFEQLTPYIQKYGKQRREEIQKKYAPKRASRC